jgi:hypothetical protein
MALRIPQPKSRATIEMIQELEQEYSSLSKKVHDLREYL